MVYKNYKKKKDVLLLFFYKFLKNLILYLNENRLFLIKYSLNVNFIFNIFISLIYQQVRIDKYIDIIIVKLNELIH